MNLIEQIARYLMGEGLPVVCGFMPQAPDRVTCVYASDLRMPRDEDGARVQLICRGDRAIDTALDDAMRASRLLDGFEGMLVAGGAYILRAQLESGPAGLSADQNNRPEYSVNFRVWYCE
ncbi:MAG: minor capsid protein [Clostridia bacterium]